MSTTIDMWNTLGLLGHADLLTSAKYTFLPVAQRNHNQLNQPYQRSI